MQKIICDICEREVDMIEDGALAMFEFIKIQPQGGSMFSFKSSSKNDPEKLIKVHFDLCSDCAEKIEIYMNEQRSMLKTQK